VLLPLALVRDARFMKAVLLRQPFSCLVQVTNRCNLQCSFCDFWPNAAPRREELTVADYERVAREMADLGCYVVSIEGGEPLVRPDIVDVVRAFAKKHLPVLFTNGWYVTPEIARDLWRAGLHQANVSIDYPDAERHDAKRGAQGTFARAWRALETFRDTAPHGGKQVNVMSVLIEDNHTTSSELFAQSRSAGVGHTVTLLSVSGYRRGKGADRLPPPAAADSLARLFDEFRHVRFFESYFELMRRFLRGGEMPTCTAGAQSMNLDHVGNVATCIERIGQPVGNVRTSSLRELVARLRAQEAEVRRCQDCFTACRGFQQALAGGGSARAIRDLATRMHTR
jgi:MoaA/NifB/PqqE/SkfB family radical SAM enzyme